MSSNAIAVRTSGDLAQITELEEILLGQKEPPQIAEDPEEISRQIIAQLLGAESDEELEQFGSATGWRDLLGVPMEIHGFSWRPSAFEQGPSVFFVVRATRLDSGENVVLTTGSANVLAQLANLAKRGRIGNPDEPCVRMLKESDRPTQAGYKPLSLVTPEVSKKK